VASKKWRIGLLSTVFPYNYKWFGVRDLALRAKRAKSSHGTAVQRGGDDHLPGWEVFLPSTGGNE
jgi:hypothetical protein